MSGSRAGTHVGVVAQTPLLFFLKNPQKDQKVRAIILFAQEAEGTQCTRDRASTPSVSRGRGCWGPPATEREGRAEQRMSVSEHDAKHVKV